MTRIEELIAQAKLELNMAGAASGAEAKDSHVMRSERLLDEAWHLNEENDDLPPLESGLWSSHEGDLARAA